MLIIPILVTDIPWDALAAIGQIISAAVALILVIIVNGSQWWNRPKVVVSHRIIKESTFHQVNLHIWNQGNTTAINVNVTVDSILQNDQPIQVASFPYRIGGTFNLQSEEHQQIHLLRIGDQLSNMELGQENWFINRQNSLFNILVTGDNITAIREVFTYMDSSSLPQVRFEKH
jgi:hypothetical protein